MKLVIHADASTIPTNPGHIGIAFHALVGGKEVVSWAYAGYGTSNQGEMLAIGLALEVLKPGRRDSVKIHTDSMYALKVLNGEWPPGANRDVASAVQGLVAPWTETMELVPGHSGLAGNEAADFAAHQAGLMGKSRTHTPVYIPPGMASSDVLRCERAVMPSWLLLQRMDRRLAERILEFHIKIRRGLRDHPYLVPMVDDAVALLGKEKR